MKEPLYFLIPFEMNLDGGTAFGRRQMAADSLTHC